MNEEKALLVYLVEDVFSFILADDRVPTEHKLKLVKALENYNTIKGGQDE